MHLSTKSAFKSSLAFILIAMSAEQTTLADTSIAGDQDGKYYYATAKKLTDSDKDVLAHCREEGGHNCKIIHRSKKNSDGYGALAQSKTMYAVSTGYGTIEGAEESAMQRCTKISPVNDQCSITMTIVDKSHHGSLISKNAPVQDMSHYGEDWMEREGMEPTVVNVRIVK